MSERAWLVRDAVRRVVSDAPAPPATWLSVARRALVVVGLFVYGLAFDNLSSAVLACFGAVQIGLMEPVLPFRRMIRLLVPLILGCTAAVALGMLIGDTWLAVVAIAALAYVFGCTAGLSERAMTLGVSALALAVIFAGMPRPPGDIPAAVAWVFLGMVVQAAASLVMWRTERRRFVRRALANKLQATLGMLREQTVTPDALVKVHAQSDVAARDLQLAGFPADEERRMRAAFSATIALSRAIIAWMVIDQPGDQERIRVGLRIARQRQRLDRLWSRGHRVADTGAVANPLVEESLVLLERAVEGVLGGDEARDVVLVAAQPAPRAPGESVWQALRPGSPHARDGVRMALGVGLAEALSLFDVGHHGFWLPLTVVFVLRPSWSLTVVRGLNRTVGNLAALLLLPFIFVSLGPTSWGLVIVLMVLAGITYRWFFGNYVIACFGLAGTILLLDFTQNPDPALFVVRVGATFLGTLVAILAILVVPGWRRDAAPQQARALISAVRRWRSDLRARLHDHTSIETAVLEADLSAGRRSLLDLEPTMVGVLLEPGDRGRPVPLAMLFAAGSRETAALMAVTYSLLAAEHHDRPLTQDERTRLVLLSHVEGAGGDFDRAAVAYDDVSASG